MDIPLPGCATRRLAITDDDEHNGRLFDCCYTPMGNDEKQQKHLKQFQYALWEYDSEAMYIEHCANLIPHSNPCLLQTARINRVKP